MLCITISSGENVIPTSGGFGWSKNRENVLKIEFKSIGWPKVTRDKSSEVFYYPLRMFLIDEIYGILWNESFYGNEWNLDSVGYLVYNVAKKNSFALKNNF